MELGIYRWRNETDAYTYQQLSTTEWSNLVACGGSEGNNTAPVPLEHLVRFHAV